MTQNETELLDAARRGDMDAFKEIVKRHEAQVAGTVIGMLGRGPEAEDIGQETFLRFYKSMKKFRGDSSVGTYLTRIAINLSLNEIKKRQRRRKLYYTDSEDKIDNIPNGGETNAQRDLKDLVHKALHKLKPDFRSVLVLRLIDGYTTQETADILKLPLGTVLSRLARAQKKLKEILTPLYWDHENGQGEENG